MERQGHEGRDSDDVVPLFGTWRVIYTAVAAAAVVVMALLSLFSAWPW